MIKTGKDTGFIVSVVGFLCILNLAIVLKVPLILQISGLVALCFLPGYLLCLLFGIWVTDPYENFLYRMGLSIIFDLFFSLGLNFLLPVFGNKTPLSSMNLHIGYSVIILILTSLIIYTDRVPAITLQPVKFHRIEKFFLIFGLIVLVCFETGIYMLNMGITNLILIFSILLIPLLLLLCIIYHNDTVKTIYPFIIFLISASLLIISAIRSNYILGVDAHDEFFLFMTTVTDSVWIPDPSLLLSAAISISLLPTIFEFFLSVDHQLLFKLLFSFLFSVTPLIVYITVKKYFSELLAMFAACFFMFQKHFVMASQLARTSIAVFFIALFIMIICNRELTNGKKYALLLLFCTGAIFSHYTSAFIFMFIIIMAYLIDVVIARTENRKETRLINIPLIVFVSSLIFFWYQQIINIVFSSGLEFTMYRNNIFIDMLNNDLGSYSAPASVYSPSPSLLLRLINYSRLTLYALIGIGILVAFYRLLHKKIPRTTALRRFDKISKTMISMALIAFILLFGGIFAPFLFFGYDVARMCDLLFVILPVFLIAGAFTLFTPVIWEEILPVSTNFLHPCKNFFLAHHETIVSAILLILLIPQLLFATYLSDQIDGSQYSILLNSPKFLKGSNQFSEDPGKFSYTFDQDAAALYWFKGYSDNRTMIFSDYYGNKKITSLVNRRSSLYQSSLLDLSENDTKDAYVYLTFANGYFARFSDNRGKETDISTLDLVFSKKNKIFANDAVLYK